MTSIPTYFQNKATSATANSRNIAMYLKPKGDAQTLADWKRYWSYKYS